MARVVQCPSCSVEVHPRASVCPACKAQLAECGWCRELTILSPPGGDGEAGPIRARAARVRHACVRCGRAGVRCRTAQVGGYCNGLARADGWLARQLCATCSGAVLGAAKTVASWTLIGLVGSRLRPPRG